VQIRRRVYDPAQREGLDGAIGARLATVDHLLVEKAFDALTEDNSQLSGKLKTQTGVVSSARGKGQRRR
jgi:hypothetical protein